MIINFKSRVPHTSILMCGHRAKLDRLPLLTRKSRHPERSAAKSKDPDTPHLTKTARPISTRNTVVFAVAVAVASEIGPGFSPDIPGQEMKPGFSLRDMNSSPSHNSTNKATA
jgi:hypothetical protein